VRVELYALHPISLNISSAGHARFLDKHLCKERRSQHDKAQPEPLQLCIPHFRPNILLGGSCSMSRKSVWPIIAGFLLLAVLSVGADMILRSFFPKAFGTSEAR